MWRCIVGRVLVVVLALGVAGCALVEGERHVLSGTVLVKDLNVRTIGSTCSGARPFLHLHAGASVVVRDGEGRELATGALGDTEAVLAYPELEELERAPSGCLLRFAVDGVPVRDSYTVEVAERHSVERTGDELEDADWTVEMEVPE